MEEDVRQDADLECALSAEHVAEIEHRFKASPEGVLNEEAFVDSIEGVIGVGTCSRRDLSMMFMRIDARCEGTVSWQAFTTFLLTGRARVTSAGHATSGYTNEELQFADASPSCKHVTMTKLLCHPTLPRYYTADEQGRVRVWNSLDLSHIQTVHDTDTWVAAMTYIQTSDVLVVATVDRVVSLYDGVTGDVVRLFRGQRTRKYRETALRSRPPRSHAVLSAAGPAVPLPELPMPWARYAANMPGRTHDESSSAGKLLSHARPMEAFDVTPLAGLADVPTAMVHVAETNRLVIGTETGLLVAYDVQKLMAPPGPTVRPSHFAGSHAYPGSEVERGSPGARNGHDGAVNVIRVAPEIESLISAGADRTIRLSSIERGCVLRVLGGDGAGLGHKKAIYGLTWSAGHRVLASCACERDILLWNPFIAKPLTRLTGSRSPMVEVAFGEAESQLFSLCADDIVRVWDIRTWRCVDSFRNKDDEALAALTFDHRQSRILAVSTRIHVRSMVKNVSDFPDDYRGHRTGVIAVVVSERFQQ
eukprot:gene9167-14216_t